MLVLGGGIGGILGARIFETLGFKVFLLEAGKRLGGCATSFQKDGLNYNAGATTLPGLYPGFPMDRIFKIIKFDPKLGSLINLLDPVCEVHLANRKYIKIYPDLNKTIEEVSKTFPIKGHETFYRFVYKVTKELLTTPFDLNFNKKLLHNLRLLFYPSNLKFFPYTILALIPALKLLKLFYQELTEEFLDFLRAQNFIVTQVPLEQTSALNFLLAIGYNFTGVGEVNGGIGALFEDLSRSFQFQLSTKINAIERKEKGYLLKGEGCEFFTERLLLAIPILEQIHILKERSLQTYFRNYHHKISPFSAFVIYGKIRKEAVKNIKVKHHLFIFKNMAPKETSDYFHLSFLSQTGDYDTFTISTHTPLKIWLNLDLERVKILKKELERKILSMVIKRLGIEEQEVSDIFSATPFTFKKHAGRLSLGGLSCSLENPFWNMPPNLPPFPGLYLTGDHAFAGQGFLGIALGCLNLYQALKKL